MPAAEIGPEDGLFARLSDACAPVWRAYTHHEFVRRLADGTLQEANFRHYLTQDYLFLVHFARAYALAAYKSETLEDIRQASAAVTAIVDTEMALHVEYCGKWGLTEPDMAAAPEANATMAYTRYVLEKGGSGDLLDLYVALAPCVVGYGEIGARLEADPETRLDGNPYADWIEMYAGDEYQAVAQAAVAQLDRISEARGGGARFGDLVKTFDQATRLEVQFWEMGLTLAE